jgi:hypothetical protein
MALSPLGVVPTLFPALQDDAGYKALATPYLDWRFDNWQAKAEARSAQAQKDFHDLELYIPARGDISAQCNNPKPMDDHLSSFLNVSFRRASV